MKISRIHFILFAMFIFPVFAVAMPKGIALVLAILGISSAGFLIYEKEWPQMPSFMLMFIPGIIWAGLSIIWSVSYLDSTNKLFQLIGVYISVILFNDMLNKITENEKKRLKKAIIYIIILVYIITLFDFATNGKFTIMFASLLGKNTKGITTYVQTSPFLKNAAIIINLILWVGLTVARINVWKKFIVFILSVFVLILLKSMTALASMIIGGLLLVIYMYARVYITVTLAIFFTIFIFIMPIMPKVLPPPMDILRAVPLIPNSMYHRLSIWEFVAEKISEKPIIGHGLDGSRAISGGKDQIVVDINIPNRLTSIHTQERLPLHPHNSVLQWWLELGLIGALLFGLPISYAIYKIPVYFKETLNQATALVILTSSIIVSMSAYGFWQSWWLSLIGICFCILKAVDKNDAST